MGMPEPIGQQGCWLDLLAEYDITIRYHPGRVHSNSDTLLRRPCEWNGHVECCQCRWPGQGHIRGTGSAGVLAAQNIPAAVSAGVLPVHSDIAAQSILAATVVPATQYIVAAPVVPPAVVTATVFATQNDTAMQ